MPRVSVVIPAFNRADLIGETLRTVLAQTFNDLEVLVVDDGSTDGTADAVRSFGSPVRYIYQQNRGQGAARNTGITAATGELIAFVDSDDVWEPDKLERQIAALAAKPDCPWVYCDAYVFDHLTGSRDYLYSRLCRPHVGHVARPLLMCDFVASPTPVVRRDVFDDVGLFDELTPQVEDWDMWLRIAARYPVAYVPAALAGYRKHQATSTGSHSALAIYRKCLGTIERVAALEPHVYAPWQRQAVARTATRTARMLVSQGDVQTARRLFAQASRLDPAYLLPFLLWATCLAGAPTMAMVIKGYRAWRSRKQGLMHKPPFAGKAEVSVGATQQ